jgi:predicted alpha-1,6-mannanase (GH76 family)
VRQSSTTIQINPWAHYAAKASEALQAHYWNKQISLFEICHPSVAMDAQFHYWWQAHALDTLIDAFERTGNLSYLSRADALFQGVLKRNGDSITNGYYDDMQWMALALLRLYDHTKKQLYLDTVHMLWQDIQTGWNEQCGGGIAWRKAQLDYKNTPANAPAIILASRLYQRFQQQDDLEFAFKIYTWLQANLVDPATGFVWDGLNRVGDGKIDKGWTFTYCQGVVIGAGLELFHSTKDESYLQQAERTADAALKRLCNPQGQLPDEGSGDGGLFKGIFARYLTLLLQARPRAKGLEMLQYNGKLLAQLKRPLSATNWKNEAEDPVDLSAALSGVMLLESLAKLEKTGRLTATVS